MRSPLTTTAIVVASLISILTPARAEHAGPMFGTFSIVARDPATGEVGAAVQSKYFNVGQSVPWVRAGQGAVCTQAAVNRPLGPRGLRLLAAGVGAAKALELLLADDPGREQRQLGVVDATGGSAAFTGSGCNAWAGHRTGSGYAVQGNILASEAVVVAMEKAFLASEGELAHRLLSALEAGQAAGGDSRGQQSAAVVVGRHHPAHPEYEKRYVDLRVDDHPTPIRELRRLYEIEESSYLVEAHTAFLELATTTGDDDLAALERDRIGVLLERVLAREDASADSLNALAWGMAVQGAFLDRALLAARRAVALRPESWEILDTLGEVLFRLGERDEAIEVQKRALSLAPDQKYLQDQIERFRSQPIPARASE